MGTKILMLVENVVQFLLNYNTGRKANIIFHHEMLLHIKFVNLIVKQYVTFIVLIRILLIV